MTLVLIFTLVALLVFGALKRQAFISRLESGEQWLRSQTAPSLEAAPSGHAQELPPLVRAFTQKVLKDSRAAKGAAFTQRGVMYSKPGASEMNFQASQLMSAVVPGFSWRATLAMGPVSVLVCDRLVDGAGGLEGRLFGAIPIVELNGPEALKGQLMRYLAELPWVPQAIVAQHELKWRELGERVVEVRAEMKGVEARVEFEFDEDGWIKRISAKDRPRDIGGGRAVPTPWVGEFSNYREVSGVMIPTHAEVRWILETGPFTYFKGDIIEYSLY